MARICAQQSNAGADAPADPDRLWLSPLAVRSARRVQLVLESFDGDALPVALPAGMCALEEADVKRCRNLAREWLPASSRQHVRTLRASRSSSQEIPADLAALHTLDLWHCAQLVAPCLPASSAAGVRVLELKNSPLTALPADMGALEVLNVYGCRKLRGNWLPESSRRCVRVLDATSTNIRGVPPGSALPHSAANACAGDSTVESLYLQAVQAVIF